ncbi:MAG: hypothetical protein DRJ40_11835 [Thermoprotei archaeon]|nr:MAG: hypothetical protein DRJ40_11835 [Thermoprotei archaeon]
MEEGKKVEKVPSTGLPFEKWLIDVSELEVPVPKPEEALAISEVPTIDWSFIKPSETVFGEKEPKGRYVLTLEVKSIGGPKIVFQKSFSSWEELSRAKDKVKNWVGGVTWYPGRKAWVVESTKRMHDTAVQVIADIFGVPEDIVRKIVEMHNIGASQVKVVGFDGPYLVFEFGQWVPRQLYDEIQRRFTQTLYIPRVDVETGKVSLEGRSITLVKVRSGKVYVPIWLLPQFLKLLSEYRYYPVFPSEVTEKLKQLFTARIEVPKKPPYRLLDYQWEAIKKWLENGARGTVVIPTGGGKTFVGIEAIRRLAVPTLILVPTEELMRQWAEKIRKYLGIEPGLLGGGHHEIKPITVATYHSASKHIDEIWDKFLLIIADEGHHLPAETFKEVALKCIAPYRLVLSATPERADQNHELIYSICGPVVFKISYPELVERGVVAPLQYYVVWGRLSSEEEKEIEKLLQEARKGRRRGISALNKIRQIIAKARWKIPVVVELVRRNPGKRIFVFTQYVDQAEELYRAIKEVEPKTALVTGEIRGREREKLFNAFKRGDIRVIVTTTVLDEGVDVPDADMAIIVSNSGQARQMIQRVGRVIRARPGKVAIVYDLVTKDTKEEMWWRNRMYERGTGFYYVFKIEPRHLTAEEVMGREQVS